jgi:nitrous oxidase accessory protein NosD
MENHMRRKWLAVGIILLFVGVTIAPAMAQNTEKQSSRGNWLYVGGSGPGNYTQIQDAINDASDNDVIFVYSGTYKENIFIDKSLSLEGLSIDGSTTGKPIIKGNGQEILVLFNAQNIHFSGFSVIGRGITTDDTGMLLMKTAGITILNNSISECHYGIQSNSCIFGSLNISNNEITKCAGAMWLSNYNSIISKNKITDCYYGLTFFQVRNYQVYQNTIIGTNFNGSCGLVLEIVKGDVFNNHIENFSWGILIRDMNFRQYYPLYFNNLNELYDQATDLRTMDSIYRDEIQIRLLPREVNIYHNNLIHNEVGAYFELFRFSTWFLLVGCFASLVENLIDLPRPLVFYHFYENYWDDKPADNTIYVIHGVIGPIGPLWILLDLLVYFFITFGPLDFFYHFLFGEIKLVNYDFHPLNEPYDIPGMSI